MQHYCRHQPYCPHQVITSSLVAFRPSLLPYKPLLGFIVLIALFLIDLLLATQVHMMMGPSPPGRMMMLIMIRFMFPAFQCML